MTPPTIFLQAVNLPDAWSKAVRTVLRDGVTLSNELGVRAKEVTSVIEIQRPYLRPMLHSQFPTKEKHLQEYIKQWNRCYDWESQGFTYTYVSRFTDYKWFDQLKVISDRIKDDLSRRNQMITWIPSIDLTESETPCLQRVWMRNLGNGTIDLHCTWRSRDLYAAWNSNYVGLLHMIYKEILEPNNLKLARLIDYCDSLHIYEADWQEAEKVKPIAVNPQIAYQ